MKVPKTFRPEKDLEAKIEELKKKLPLLENYKDIRTFLKDGIGEYEYASHALFKKFMPDLIRLTYDGRITWKKYGENNTNKDRYITKMVIKNRKGVKALVPVRLTVFKGLQVSGQLNFGMDVGFCRNAFNKEVANFLFGYFENKK